MPLGKDEIRHLFGNHQGTIITAPLHVRIRDAFIAFGEFLDDVIPDGDAKDIAFINLKQSSMWANFGISEMAPLEKKTPPPKPAPPSATPVRPR